MMREGPTKWGMGDVRQIGYCTMCIILIGFVMLVAGAIVCGIAFTEVRPNVADENYERYIRSDLKRVVGPIMLAFGLLCIVGGCVFFGLTLCSSMMTTKKKQDKNYKYNVRASEEHLPYTPDADKKMLSDV